MDCLEEAVKAQAELVQTSLRHDGFDFDSEEVKSETRKEARRALLPSFVINLSSGAVHRPCHSFFHRGRPEEVDDQVRVAMGLG